MVLKMHELIQLKLQGCINCINNFYSWTKSTSLLCLIYLQNSIAKHLLNKDVSELNFVSTGIKVLSTY